MTTTAVFAEILAIGIQACVLLAVAVAAFVDLGPALSAVGGWEALMTIAFLAIAYVVGVIVDRLADTALTPLRNRVSDHDTGTRARMRRRVLAEATPLSSFLEYQRSRMRLMRGTILNLVIAVPVANAFLLFRLAEANPGHFVVVNLVTIGLLLACVFAFVEIVRAQDKWLDLIARPAEVDPPVEQGL